MFAEGTPDEIEPNFKNTLAFPESHSLVTEEVV